MLNVRVATENDMPAMISVVNDAFAIETGAFFEGTRTDAARMAEMMREGQFLVAENEAGEIIGSVYVEREGERGYFGVLAVDPKCQGNGLGRVLVKAAEDWARGNGCTAMDLWVLSARTDLPPYYGKLGYVETAETEFTPSRPMKPGTEPRCIVMSKQL
jgi:predicted N-acetyltransferase YhbS